MKKVFYSESYGLFELIDSNSDGFSFVDNGEVLVIETREVLEANFLGWSEFVDPLVNLELQAVAA
jgi:hypothetical protein